MAVQSPPPINLYAIETKELSNFLYLASRNASDRFWDAAVAFPVTSLASTPLNTFCYRYSLNAA